MTKKEDLWRIEEEFHSQDHKLSRKERKRASIKDRSKFKKSDQDQLKKRHDSHHQNDLLKRGRVLAIQPEGIVVSCETGQILCSLKGTLKQDKNRVKNLIAVGDWVGFEEVSSSQGCIVKIEERHSILSRADNLSRNKEQLIAVNIDQVLITASVVQPPLKPFLIDRYIIAALKGNMQPIILMNKIDLLNSHAEEKALYEELLQIYQDLHFTVVPLSVKTGEGLDALRTVMQDKTSVFSGQSGVGKSSLINEITGSSLATGDVVHKTGKGSHTTTTTHLVPLAGGGFCIDTPGIKSFGLWDLRPEDIASYFPEIDALKSECKYLNCAHLNEPDCAVKAAALEHIISPLRFASYSALMTSVSEQHTQR